ncbi:MAG TPA: hypothetical protein VJB61_11300 [Actinomycetota bacterium]
MEAGWGEWCDDLDPVKILLLRDAGVGLRAVVVVDNLAAGPAIGGVGMAPTSPSPRWRVWLGR